MKERPILFSAPMVRAILDGRKTQTRRVVKWQRDKWDVDEPERVLQRRIGYWCFRHGTRPVHDESEKKCPYGVPGDRLWVRESWFDNREKGGDAHPFLYAASLINPDRVKWRPSIRMPRLASRLTLKITGVRVERLQEISEADAIAEGCGWSGGESFRDLAVLEYVRVWEEINGKGSWAANPWVWVVEFRRVEA